MSTSVQWFVYGLCLCAQSNKTPIVWLSTISHRGKCFPDMYNVMRKWQIISDEYPVENTHSIIRAQTQNTDTADNLSNKVKAIFQSK